MASKVLNFIKEAQQELKKVVWPTKDELLGSTLVVIVVTFILALFIVAVDLFLSQFIKVLMR